MKILIVDGSRQKRQTMVEVLGELTNVIIQGAVPDLRSALRAVVDATPDVVVTGALLPDGEGTQLIERIRKLKRTPSIVVVTPAKSDEQRERYLAAGADHYVDPDELSTTVATLAQRRSAIPPNFTLELLGRMTAAVIHDLNNYLGVLELMLTLLRRQPTDETLWQQAHVAVDAIRRLDGTLLEYARGGTPEREPNDLGVIARDIVALAGRLIPTTVKVTVEVDADRKSVTGVRSDLEQLVLNLVVNACDAMPEGGELTVRVRNVPYAMLLEIGDTGRGELTPGRSSKRPGIGLGLGIVHAVVERHAGAIRILGRPTGGTLVAVMLPA